MFALLICLLFTFFVAMRCVSDLLKRRDGVKCRVREDWTASQRRILMAETLESFVQITFRNRRSFVHECGVLCST